MQHHAIGQTPKTPNKFKLNFFVMSTGEQCDQIGQFIGLWAAF